LEANGGKACWVPLPERAMGEAGRDAFEVAVRDRMHERLTAERR
jgi:hypothetical protein